jgi:hypothetical protein
MVEQAASSARNRAKASTSGKRASRSRDEAHKGHDLDNPGRELLQPYLDECRACLADGWSRTPTCSTRHDLRHRFRALPRRAAALSRPAEDKNRSRKEGPDDRATAQIAIIGGSRIPFCRSNSSYADQTNLDMLTAAFQGVVDRYELSRQENRPSHRRRGHRAFEGLEPGAGGGAVDHLSPLTPGNHAAGLRHQPAGCAAGRRQIATGEIECAHRGGTDTTRTCRSCSSTASPSAWSAQQGEVLRQKLKAVQGLPSCELAPQPPRNAEPRTGLSMGEHCERMAREWKITRKEQDELALDSHHKAAEAWDRASSTIWSCPTTASCATTSCAPTRPGKACQPQAGFRPLAQRHAHGRQFDQPDRRRAACCWPPRTGRASTTCRSRPG